MKYFNKTTLSIALVAIFGYVSLNYQEGPGQFGGQTATGAPFDGQYCGTSCHGGGTFTPSVIVQLKSGSTNVTSYTPGASYNVIVTVSSSTSVDANTRYGFQITGVNSSNGQAGTWGAPPANTHIYNNGARDYVEHGQALTSGVITIPWTAPTAGTGTVIFYAAGNVVNGDNTNQGDNATTTSATFNEACSAPSLSATATNVLCNGGTTGAVTLTTTGGSAPFTYAWTGPSGYTSTAKSPTGLAAGTYNVTVTANGGCTNTTTATVTQPATAVSATASANTPCVGGTLNLTGGGSGGTGTLTYSWTGPNSYTNATQSPSITTVTSAAAGLYTLTVKDANNCTKTSNVTVTLNQGPTVTPAITNELCNAGTTGAVSLTVSGGGGSTYTYAWTGPSSFSSALQNISSLATGTYSVNVTGTNTCVTTTTAAVTQPTVIAPTASTNSPVCVGGTLQLTGGGSGGTGTLTYSWTGPNTYTNATQSPAITSVAALAAGTYTITVKDANNCTKTATTAAALVDAPATLGTSFTAPLCNGGSTGSITLTPTGGTTPLSYSWTGPSSYTSTTQSPTGLAAGTYTVNVKSANLACSTQTTVVVTQPTVITASAATNSPICTGSALNFTGTGSGGTGSLTYSWTGPNAYTNATQSPSINPAKVLQSGVYTLTVKDANNCTKPATTTAEVDTLPTLTTTPVNVTCNGNNNGSINLTATQGLPPYTYTWTGPNSFTSANQNIASLAPGTYTISVVGNCAGSIPVVKNVVITEPTVIVPSAASNSPLCAGATLNLTGGGSGGTGTLTYSWAGPNSYTNATQSPSVTGATNTAAGSYTLTVKDANNCTKTANTTVVVNALPVVSLGRDTDICVGDSLHLDAGNAGATYSWSTTAATQTITVTTAATYSVAVTNSNNCIGHDTVVVAVDSTPHADSIVAAKASSHTFNCSVAGAHFTTIYGWSFGDGDTSTNATPNHTYAAAGTYTIRLIIANKCSMDTLTTQVTADSFSYVGTVQRAAAQVRLYPNPGNNFITVDNKSGWNMTYMTVYNVVGARVYEGKAGNSQSVTINTSSFAPGIYTMRVETVNGTITKKFEIVK